MSEFMLKCVKYSDVTLVMEDGEIMSSKFLLAAKSDYFSNLFQSDDFKESNGLVKLPYKKLIMEKVLHHLYGGKLDFSDLSQDQKCEMLEIIKMLKITDPQEPEEEKLVHSSAASQWMNSVKSLVSGLDLSLSDLEEKVLPSGLFDKNTILRKIVKKQEVALKSIQCKCDRCDCLESIMMNLNEED